MSELLQAVERIFTHDGPLAQVDAHFRVREGQTQMAQAVAQTVEQGGALVVERARAWEKPLRIWCRLC